MSDGTTSRRQLVALVALVIALPVALQLFGQWSRARLGERVAAQARPGEIRMIGSTTCVYCAQAREWFQTYRVPFSECVIETDAVCADQYRALLAPGTPVMIVRGRRLVGFDAQAVARALDDTPQVLQ